MSATARRNHGGHRHHHQHSLNQRSPSSASTTFASSSTAFASRYYAPSPSPSPFLHRSSSPTRVTLSPQPSQSSPSIRFSLDRSISPTSNRPLCVSSPRAPTAPKGTRRTCLCSPTTHPGSFRCSLHKSSCHPAAPASSYAPSRLNARRSAMTNSLVRICGVEGGDLVKRALSALIRPSSHQQRRRAAFQPRPSRLSVMSKA